MLKKRFFFTRHGETDWNVRQLCQGQKDIPLNAKGLSEARALAEEYRHVNIPSIVSSPLTRALQTAKAILDVQTQTILHIIPELSERCWGTLEGMASEEMYAIEKLEEQDPLYVVGHGVEKREAFRKRVLHGILLAQSHHPHPFIVSHGRFFLELCIILDTVPIRQIKAGQVFEIAPALDKWTMNIRTADEVRF